MPTATAKLSSGNNVDWQSLSLSFELNGTTYTFFTGDLPPSVRNFTIISVSLTFSSIEDLEGTMTYTGHAEGDTITLTMDGGKIVIVIKVTPKFDNPIDFTGIGRWTHR